MATSAAKSRRASEQRKRDLAAIAMIKASGILSPSAKLDDILKLSERLSSQALAGGHTFIFRNVVFSECPF
jgi:hypothetical protein